MIIPTTTACYTNISNPMKVDVTTKVNCVFQWMINDNDLEMK